MELIIQAVKKISSAVNSCQSAVKLYLKKLLYLTLLSFSTLNIAFFNILLIDLMAPEKIWELDLNFFASAETWHIFWFWAPKKTYIVENQLSLTELNSNLA